jgi:histone H3/H4
MENESNKGQTTKDLANQFLKLQILKLSSLTYDKASSTAISALTDVTERYFKLVASFSQAFANAANRQRPNLHDISASLNMLKTKPSQLLSFAEAIKSSATASTDHVPVRESKKDYGELSPEKDSSEAIPIEDFLPPLYLDTVYPVEDDLDDFLWSLLSDSDENLSEEEKDTKSPTTKELTASPVLSPTSAGGSEKSGHSTDSVGPSPRGRGGRKSKRGRKSAAKARSKSREVVSMDIDTDAVSPQQPSVVLVDRVVTLDQALENFFPPIPDPNLWTKVEHIADQTSTSNEEDVPVASSAPSPTPQVDTTQPAMQEIASPPKPPRTTISNRTQVDESFLNAVSSLNQKQSPEGLHPAFVQPQLASEGPSNTGSCDIPASLISGTFPILNTTYHDALDSVYTSVGPLSSSTKLQVTLPSHLEALSCKLTGRRKSSLNTHPLQDIFDKKTSLTHDEMDPETENDSYSEADSRSARADSTNSAVVGRKKKRTSSVGLSGFDAALSASASDIQEQDDQSTKIKIPKVEMELQSQSQESVTAAAVLEPSVTSTPKIRLKISRT